MSKPNEPLKDRLRRKEEEKNIMLARKVNIGAAHGLNADQIRKMKDGSEEAIEAQAELLAEIQEAEEQPTGEQLALDKQRRKAEAQGRAIHPQRRFRP